MRRNRFRKPIGNQDLEKSLDEGGGVILSGSITEKLISCDQILGLYRAFGGETSRGAINLYLLPLKSLILSLVLHNRIPAWSIGGEIPEWILSPQVHNSSSYFLEGLHLRTSDLTTAIETCQFGSTIDGGMEGYHGGDIDTPMRNALRAAHDYTPEIGLKLVRFNFGWEDIDGGDMDDDDEDGGPLGKNSMLRPHGGPLITHPR